VSVVPRVSEASIFVHPAALVESAGIGDNTRVWAFAHIMPGVTIGSECNIGDHAFIETGARLGNNVTVKNGVAIWDGVRIEDNVFLGPNCVLTNDPNPRAYIKKKSDQLLRTLIRSHATIGANATILCGVTIGQYAFIGAGAVVIRSVPDFALIVGNPGRHLGWMCVCAHRLPFPLQLPIDLSLVCPQCGNAFTRTSEGQLTLSTAG
jgi:UDP-2-acetamido-3-amino-2,3-dideoxy-glucuronate N-acetyltransferase